MKKSKSNKNLYQVFSLVLICICSLGFSMCSNGGSKVNSSNAEQSSDSTDFYSLLTYFTSSSSLIDSEYIELEFKNYSQIPLNLLLRVTGLDYDTISNVKEAYALRDLSNSKNYYSLFYGLSCLAGGNCEAFYISNFSLNGKVLFNEKIALNRADLENVQDNYFNLVNDSVIRIKTIVSFYDDGFNYMGDSIGFSQIEIHKSRLIQRKIE
jgi:hypothetical protein